MSAAFWHDRKIIPSTNPSPFSAARLRVPLAKPCLTIYPSRYTDAMLLLKKLPKFETMRECAKRYPQLDPTALQTSLVLLRVASDLIAAMDAELAGHGTSQGRFTILMLLENCPQSNLTPSDLAEMSGVSRASISGLIDGLETSGM